MKLVRYTAEKSHQWNDFVRTSRNGFFMFERGYMEYHADRFEDYSLMAYDEKEKLVALLPTNRKADTLHSHQGLTFGGFIVGARMNTAGMLALFTALKEHARNEGFETLLYKAIPYFYHRQPAQEDLYALFRHGARVSRVDVSSLIHMNARPAFSSSRKSGLARARLQDMRVTRSDEYAAFFAIMNERLESKYEVKATHTADEMALLATRFPNNIHLYGCFKGNDMLAGVIIYETDRVAHTQYIGATEQGRALGATDYLLDELINTVYTDKLYFDFGISTTEAGRALNEGLIAQKEGTGAQAAVHQFFELDF